MRNTTRRRSVTAFTAAIALAIPLAVVGVLPGGGGAPDNDGTVLTPATALAGQVVLTTTSSGATVTWRDKVQRFTGGQQCEVTPQTPSDPVLTVSGSISNTAGTDIRTAQAGFRDGDIGVFEISTASSPSNASQCFRVDAGSFTDVESLTLRLDPTGDFSDAPFSTQPLRAEKATVDARAQSQSGRVLVSFLNATGQVFASTPYTWGPRAKSGSRIDNIPALVAPNGALFSGIKLTTTSGSLSLRGATFDLQSQAEDNLCPGESRTEGTTSVKYVGGANGSIDCFPVSLEKLPNSLRFLKPSTVAPDAQFVFNLPWGPLPNESGLPDTGIPATDIDFEIGDTNFTDLKFCSSYDQTILGRNAAGERSILDFEAFNDPDTGFPDFDPNLVSNVKEFACVDVRDVTTLTEDEVSLFDTIFVIGDLRMVTGR